MGASAGASLTQKVKLQGLLCASATMGARALNSRLFAQAGDQARLSSRFEGPAAPGAWGAGAGRGAAHR